jgi:hypothetical protein
MHVDAVAQVTCFTKSNNHFRELVQLLHLLGLGPFVSDSSPAFRWISDRQGGCPTFRLLFHCRFSVRHLAVDCVPVYVSDHREPLLKILGISGSE